jgi:uncharacterized membrane protein YoaK (UPF0700 family)
MQPLPSDAAKSAPEARHRARVILLLSIAGAGVDAVLIMGFNVLTAAQTGNTILMAVALVRGEIFIGISAAVSVLAYVLGAGLGHAFLIVHPPRPMGVSTASKALMIEMLFLIALVVLWDSAKTVPQSLAFVLVALAAVAMGMQSAIVRRLHGGPTTTYVTGTLTDFTTGIIDKVRHRSVSGSANSFDGPLQKGLVWTTYVGGALVTGLIYLAAGELALLLPILSILIVVWLNPRAW